MLVWVTVSTSLRNSSVVASLLACQVCKVVLRSSPVMSLSLRNSTMRDLARAWLISQMKPISCTVSRWRLCTWSMTSATFLSTSRHSSVGVEGGCGQVVRGSSWVGVELSPWQLHEDDHSTGSSVTHLCLRGKL